MSVCSTMLIKAQNWIVDTFSEGSRPHLRTVKRWVEKGEIEGVTISGNLYIDAEIFAHKVAGNLDKPEADKKEWELL